MTLPVPGTGGRCRPVIIDDIHEVVFQIGFPARPAECGANSTGRITPVAAWLRECGLYKQSTNKKVKRHTALLLKASKWGKWGYVLREGSAFLSSPTYSTITCQSNQILFTLSYLPEPEPKIKTTFLTCWACFVCIFVLSLSQPPLGVESAFSCLS